VLAEEVRFMMHAWGVGMPALALGMPRFDNACMQLHAACQLPVWAALHVSMHA
jgi:hypothetical protein